MGRRPLATLLWVCALFLAMSAPPTSAAVGFRQAACGSGAGNSVDVPAVAGTQVNDLYVVTVTAQAADWDTIYEPLNAGWNWAGVGNGMNGLLMASFWRRATASDPASWTFTVGGGTGVTMGYAVQVFTGADPVNDPIAYADEFDATAPSTSDAFPTTTGPYDGMMRVLSAGAAANVSQSIGGGPTMRCNQQVGGASIAAASEAVNSGTSPSRSVTRSASAYGMLHALLIRPACSTGGMTIAPPSAVSFPSRTLTGVDTSTTASFTLGIDDQRASAAGWHVELAASTFTTGTANLPADATTITSTSETAGAGRCGAPTNVISYPVTVPTTAVTIYDATSLTGQGPSTVTANARVAIPASARIGTYSSTWTFSIVSGP